MRLYVVVEGPTEETFVRSVLAPHLFTMGVQAIPIIVTTSRDRVTGKKNRGGGHWKHWFKDLKRLSAENPGSDVRFTTLFDLYGLPDDFPNLDAHLATRNTAQRASDLEAEMQAVLGDHRFLPYLQRHEFEALVLACLDAIQPFLDAPDGLDGLDTLRTSLVGCAPEDVDDGDRTAPSKRLVASIPGYVKTLHGPYAIEATGLTPIRAVCPRFDAWLTKLEQLSPSGAP